jgi:hypothetical protein
LANRAADRTQIGDLTLPANAVFLYDFAEWALSFSTLNATT